MREIRSDSGYSLRCPRDPNHVFFEGVFTLRVEQRVVVDWEGRAVESLLSDDVRILADALDGRTPVCTKCGCEAMVGRPPETVVDEEIPW